MKRPKMSRTDDGADDKDLMDPSEPMELSRLEDLTPAGMASVFKTLDPAARWALWCTSRGMRSAVVEHSTGMATATRVDAARLAKQLAATAGMPLRRLFLGDCAPGLLRQLLERAGPRAPCRTQLGLVEELTLHDWSRPPHPAELAEVAALCGRLRSLTVGDFAMQDVSVLSSLTSLTSFRFYKAGHNLVSGLETLASLRVLHASTMSVPVALRLCERLEELSTYLIPTDAECASPPTFSLPRMRKLALNGKVSHRIVTAILRGVPADRRAGLALTMQSCGIDAATAEAALDALDAPGELAALFADFGSWDGVMTLSYDFDAADDAPVPIDVSPLARLRNMKNLYISVDLESVDVPGHMVGPAGIGALTMLEELNISGHSGGWGEYSFMLRPPPLHEWRLPHLRRLTLFQLDDIPAAVVAAASHHLPMLEELDLDGTPLVHDTPVREPRFSLPSLRKLHAWRYMPCAFWCGVLRGVPEARLPALEIVTGFVESHTDIAAAAEAPAQVEELLRLAAPTRVRKLALEFRDPDGFDLSLLTPGIGARILDLDLGLFVYDLVGYYEQDPKALRTASDAAALASVFPNVQEIWWVHMTHVALETLILGMPHLTSMHGEWIDDADEAVMVPAAVRACKASRRTGKLNIDVGSSPPEASKVAALRAASAELQLLRERGCALTFKSPLSEGL